MNFDLDVELRDRGLEISKQTRSDRWLLGSSRPLSKQSKEVIIIIGDDEEDPEEGTPETQPRIPATQFGALATRPRESQGYFMKKAPAKPPLPPKGRPSCPSSQTLGLTPGTSFTAFGTSQESQELDEGARGIQKDDGVPEYASDTNTEDTHQGSRALEGASDKRTTGDSLGDSTLEASSVDVSTNTASQAKSWKRGHGLAKARTRKLTV
ncbi:hypothetical protein AOQ84DRAFT_423750 [Glonium stellatum]|uniref:Uncharacterized protein n=1 Tax=Glonium stellatum TaxID=574774 RepID=A0A8E2JLZ3_9PEZI|nr:hypothetical protein AOQ84DRAFT_423750 [Glonium stellatum]